MRLWLANLNPKATDEEIRDLVTRYTKLEITKMTHVPGDGTRPGVMLEFAQWSDLQLFEAQRRLDGLYWKERKLLAHLPGGAASSVDKGDAK